MKSVKLDQKLAEMILQAGANVAWRILYDDNVYVNEELRLIDYGDPPRAETGSVIGIGRVTCVLQRRLGEIKLSDTITEGLDDGQLETFTTLQKTKLAEVSATTVYNVVTFIFCPVRTRENATNTTVIPAHVQLYTDGGSRGNPGPSASGYVVVKPIDKTAIVDKGVYLGVTTNNQAEYLALKYGLEEVRRMGARQVDCYLDSMLVVNQMNGLFKIRNRDLWPVHEAIKELVASFDTVRFTHVPRELNSLADAAVNRTLDEALHVNPAQN